MIAPNETVASVKASMPYRLCPIAIRLSRVACFIGFAMHAEDRARKLCERAVASQDLDELDAILVELRALLRDHFAHISNLTQERRRRANLEHVLGRSA